MNDKFPQPCTLSITYIIDGKFPTVRTQMPALTRLPNLYTGTIPPVNFPKMCLILDHLIPTLSLAIVR